MKTFKGNRLLSKVITHRKKYASCVSELENYLKDKIEFEFSIDFQPSDGHMLLNVESNTRIAPVAECLSVIYMKGTLSEYDHGKLCI